MYTIESFCNSIWGNSYSKVLLSVTKDDYEEFEIPKKAGMRKINYLHQGSPLMELQKKLLVNFLENQPLPVCAKGFKKGESYLTFLSPHTDSNFFLRIDIEAFFPTISEGQIKNELAMFIGCNPEEDKNKLLELICDITTLNHSLPQGACTSPAVSNLVMARVDQRILKYCQMFDICYTRYADDLLFSSRTFDFYEKKWFLKKIKYILNTQKFKVNYSKIKYGNNSLILNGYVISNSGIQLSRNRLSDIRHVCSFVKNNYSVYETSGAEKFLGLANTLRLKHRDLTIYPFTSVFQIVQYLCGYRAFLLSLIDNNNKSTPFQKQLLQLIRRIEQQILKLS